MEYEESPDGWVLLRWREDKHNHDLKCTQADIRASSATRGGIPERFHVFGRVMSSPTAVLLPREHPIGLQGHIPHAGVVDEEVAAEQRRVEREAPAVAPRLGVHLDNAMWA